MPRIKPRFHKLMIRWILYWLSVFILRPAMELPQWLSNYLISKFALLGYYVSKSNRNVALSNLRVAFRDKLSNKELHSITNDMFLNFGRSLSEFIKMPMWRQKHIIESVVGAKYLNLIRDARKKGRGVIVATGHIGNWELLAAYTAIHFPLSVIARRLYFKPFDKEVVARRNRLGMEVIYQQDGIKPILRALKKNHVIGILVDQDIKGVASDFVDFFGIPANTPNAHAAMHLTTGAALIAAALVRTGNKKSFEILANGPIEIEKTGDKALDRINIVQKWSDMFEKFVRSHPDQWAWFHPRWKTRPPENFRV